MVPGAQASLLCPMLLRLHLVANTQSGVEALIPFADLRGRQHPLGMIMRLRKGRTY